MKNAAEFNNSAAFFMLVMHGQGLRNYLQKNIRSPLSTHDPLCKRINENIKNNPAQRH